MQKNEFELLVLAEGGKETLPPGDTLCALEKKGLIKDEKITDEGLSALEPYRVKRAIFLAAGFGSRMVPLTLTTPKPLVPVHGTRMIDTLLDAALEAGIPEIIIVRGYLGEQFDELLKKYPMIKFIDNPLYNEANNISSAVAVRDILQSAYVLESDLVLENKSLIRRYEYSSNFLGIPVEESDDWCLYTDKDGYITKQTVGGTNCHQMIGISFWSPEDGEKLSRDLEEVYLGEGGKDRYWDQVPLHFKKENYKVSVRECKKEDIVEIDSFEELKQIDPTYAE
ncbi:MAG: phosphocholine cytidylyltransferase family protein [Ruminococcaceae bacterium]|nr:phosphocholine cytidylyltransferase family protein [Oscillospiraceae bacterium]